MTKRCSKCDQDLSLDSFGQNKRAPDGKRNHCKPCYNAYMAKYYKENPEPVKARTARYFAANREELNWKRKEFRQRHLERENASVKLWAQLNPDKVRAAKSKNRAKRKLAVRYQVTATEVRKMLSAKCFYCEANDANQLDHVVPLSRGGCHSVGNLVGACAPCNLQKNNKTIMEWRIWKAKIAC